MLQDNLDRHERERRNIWRMLRSLAQEQQDRSRSGSGRLRRFNPSRAFPGLHKKNFAAALETNSDFSNSLFRRQSRCRMPDRVRQRKWAPDDVLRSFVSNLLYGGLGYEDLRFRSPLALDHWLRPPSIC